eukprot:TCONS_00024677-protein
MKSGVRCTTRLFFSNDAACKNTSRYFSNTYEYFHLNGETILLPNVIIWEPLTTNEELYCPHCFEDNGTKELLVKTQPLQWTQCQSNSMNPKRVYDLGWMCIIVGQIYICSLKHRIISYHAGVLKQLQPSLVPFTLLHDAGVTNRLLDFIL